MAAILHAASHNFAADRGAVGKNRSAGQSRAKFDLSGSPTGFVPVAAVELQGVCNISLTKLQNQIYVSNRPLAPVLSARIAIEK